MSIVDTLQKLKIQANAIMRGIHPDFVLIERKDLEQLLEAYNRLYVEAWNRDQCELGGTDSVWSKLPAEFKHDLESRSIDKPPVEDLILPDKVCNHKWVRFDYDTEKMHCTGCGALMIDKVFNHIPVAVEDQELVQENVAPKLDEDFDVPQGCLTDLFSSRMCGHGTKGCVIVHGEEKGKTLEDCKAKFNNVLNFTTPSQADYDKANAAVGFVPDNYPDMVGQPTVAYIPLRRREAADCKHNWIQQPMSHVSRCTHCGATRSES
jgi:hypothetical protein